MIIMPFNDPPGPELSVCLQAKAVSLGQLKTGEITQISTLEFTVYQAKILQSVITPYSLPAHDS